MFLACLSESCYFDHNSNQVVQLYATAMRTTIQMLMNRMDLSDTAGAETDMKNYLLRYL